MDRISSVSVSSKGDMFLSSSRDKSARLWDIGGQKLMATFPSASAAAFDPTGNLMAIAYPAAEVAMLTGISGVKSYINLHSLAKDFAVPLVTYSLSEGVISAIAFSPNGHFLICNVNNGLIILDAYSGVKINSFGTASTFCEATISPDSQYIAYSTKDTGEIEVRNTVKGTLACRLVPTDRDGADCIVFGRKHLVMASAGKDVVLWLPVRPEAEILRDNNAAAAVID